MKQPVILSLILILLSSFTQDCSFEEHFTEGKGWEYTNYNAKGKSEGTVLQQVKSVDHSGDSVIFNIDSKIESDKGDPVAMSFEMFCLGSSVRVDMKSITGTMAEQLKGMEVNVDSDEIDYPTSSSVGDTLKQSKLKINGEIPGTPMKFNMTITIKDRKVVAKEEITTPAGTFDCYVIEQVTVSKGMMMNQEIKSKEWFSPDYGMVRTETFKKNGKLESYSELTKLL
ncbi:DUF3108 domain-containing protein [bacterium]|nr:DUF3108 domain-containing protein [bacterium]